MKTWLLLIPRALLSLVAASLMAGCEDSDDDSPDTVVVTNNVGGDADADADEEAVDEDEEADGEEAEPEEPAAPEPQVMYDETLSLNGVADPLFRQTSSCVPPASGTMTATMTWDDGGEVHAWLNRSDESEAESQDTSPIVLTHTTGPGQDWWVEIRNGSNDGIQKRVNVTITYTPDE
ncbi:MAG TPA: hypothetical protein P5567_14420 [Kiritimatiellia bacterium]|nr:hypothetical protein [Kiritimatiellia bacterium]HSA19268.1 hypothetical protein [Kiritimatiellia bacterium]